VPRTVDHRRLPCKWSRRTKCRAVPPIGSLVPSSQGSFAHLVKGHRQPGSPSAARPPVPCPSQREPVRGEAAVKALRLAANQPLAASKASVEGRRCAVLAKRGALVDVLATIVRPDFKRRDGGPAEVSSHMVCQQLETRQPFVAINSHQGGLGPGRSTDELALGPPSPTEQVEGAVRGFLTGCWAQSLRHRPSHRIGHWS